MDFCEKRLKILKAIIRRKREAADRLYWADVKCGYKDTEEAKEAYHLYQIYSEIENEYIKEIESLC